MNVPIRYTDPRWVRGDILQIPYGASNAERTSAAIDRQSNTLAKRVWSSRLIDLHKVKTHQRTKACLTSEADLNVAQEQDWED